MPFAMIVCWLEEKGYRRDQILCLTRSYVRAVLDWPRGTRGELRKPPAPQSEDEESESQEQAVRRWYFERGWPAHKVEPEVRKWRERMAQAAQHQEQDAGDDFGE